MNTTYEIFKIEVYNKLMERYEDCEYSNVEKLREDIYFDGEEILESCVEESLFDVVEDGVGELACSCLKEMDVTIEMLLKIISDPKEILYYSYDAVFDEVVEDFVENFDYIEDWD